MATGPRSAGARRRHVADRSPAKKDPRGLVLPRPAQEHPGTRRRAEVLYDERHPPVFDPLVVSRLIRKDQALGSLTVADRSDSITLEAGGLDQIEADGLCPALPKSEVVLGRACTIGDALDGKQDVRIILVHDVAETRQHREILWSQIVLIEIEVDRNVKTNRRLEALDGDLEFVFEVG